MVYDPKNVNTQIKCRIKKSYETAQLLIYIFYVIYLANIGIDIGFSSLCALSVKHMTQSNSLTTSQVNRKRFDNPFDPVFLCTLKQKSLHIVAMLTYVMRFKAC